MLRRLCRVLTSQEPAVRLLQFSRTLTITPTRTRCLSPQDHSHTPATAVPGSDNQQKSGLIWEGYKRNFKGSIPPNRTRLRCKRGTKLCGNPCPICCNKIQITYTDHQLLEQFICPHTGKVLDTSKTGLCRQQHKKLVKEVEKAWDHGILVYPTPRELPEEIYKIPPWNQINIRASIH